MDGLFEIVYTELRARAHRHRRRWNRDFTLNTTAIVHEAYERLAEQSVSDFSSRAHFLCVASTAMRHVLIDYARKRSADKRGGDKVRVPFQEEINHEAGVVLFKEDESEDLIRLHESLSRLEQENERWAKVVDCKFFGGMSIEQIAESLGVSTATVKRDWALAKIWLYQAMTK